MIEKKTLDCSLCCIEPSKIYLEHLDFSVIESPFAKKWPGAVVVVAKNHVKEMTDLPIDAAISILELCYKIEKVMIEKLKPKKVNWAQFGNVVPHLHWHIIPRYFFEPFSENSVWECLSQEFHVSESAIQISIDFYANLRNMSGK